MFTASTNTFDCLRLAGDGTNTRISFSDGSFLDYTLGYTTLGALTGNGRMVIKPDIGESFFEFYGDVDFKNNIWGDGGTISNFLQAGTFTTNTPTAGQIAKYNATDGRWYAADDSTGSGISADTATNIARDAWSLAYVVEPAYGTATVARTFSDTYYREFSTYCTNATELNIDVSTFPTNGGAVFGWVVNPMGNTMTVNSDAIDTNSWADVELTTNAYNRLIFDKAPYETKFYVTGR